MSDTLHINLISVRPIVKKSFADEASEALARLQGRTPSPLHPPPSTTSLLDSLSDSSARALRAARSASDALSAFADALDPDSIDAIPFEIRSIVRETRINCRATVAGLERSDCLIRALIPSAVSKSEVAS